ncbi:MAG: preprotein translocase subunit SecA [Pseudomonadales bacterium]|jgi:preprotein translocase subunit SecA|nr:preprotein translocase subunit SecA [Pseudomonadales bacterium]
MIGRLFGALLPNKNTRELRRMGRLVKRINELEEQTAALDDAALKDLTASFRARLDDGERLDALLPEAFAAVREAARRTLGMRNFDVQLLGGITLHEGRIAEMRTGEGKTLVATLPVYLNALTRQGVHVVTVNDYLARRDATWMAPVYQALGMSVGIVVAGQDGAMKRDAYACDIVYGTNNEFGFDYLRDNMAFTAEDKVQRSRHFAIVDEVDSILIDEARTPLIISGPAEDSSEVYRRINELVPILAPRETPAGQEPEGEDHGDFAIDEKNKQVELLESGHEKIEHALVAAGMLAEGDSLYAPGNLSLLHHVHAALRAHFVYRRDVEYVVQGGQVVIVDEHTGRTMPGRRWSDGLHQAIEAKEKVRIQQESQTLASTTFQNFFRLYEKLAGMTGTADTEAFEFRQIYGLDVVVIPTNRPMVREDQNDLVFLSMDEKYEAIAEDIQDCRERGQPVLVGTASIESSERLSKELDRRGIPHNVLNAKFHEKEAQVIAQAGRPGTVTVATNMAGRGTDIVLGGNWEAELEDSAALSEAERERHRSEWEERHAQVLEAGGLRVIGTERHESRRIDNQLRGRSGRQGDPGSTRFYLSMEDNLMRIFASDRIRAIMNSLGMERGEAIEHRMVTNAIERAQRKVEGHNFDIRKNLLEYDDVSNDQRQVIYAQRDELMAAEDISETIAGMRAEVVDDVISEYLPPGSLEEQWDVEGLEQALIVEFDSQQPLRRWLEEDEQLDEEGLRERILEQIEAECAAKEEQVGSEVMRRLEKHMMLLTLDQLWKEHLQAMDQLRQGIHLRAYAQKQPKQEYKRESFELFQALLYNIRRDVVRLISRAQFRQADEAEEQERQRREEAARRMELRHQEARAFDAADEAELPLAAGEDRVPPRGPGAASAKPETFVRDGRKVGRNEPCPCGSGRKYKHCHGRAD